MSGLMPPIVAWAPLMPPFSSRQGAVGHSEVPASPGKAKPNGGWLPVPCVKIGGLAELAKKVGRMSPGGFPRNCSWMLAGVSQLEYIPTPPRTSQSPLPLTSHAAPTRGFQTFGELFSACSDGLAIPLATCSWNVEPLPRMKFPKTVESDREYGLPWLSKRRPSVSVRLRRAFQVSWTKAPHVFEAASQSQSCCWPVMGLYITPPSFAGASCASFSRLSKLKPGCDHGPWKGSTSSPNQPS
jgi:hypothetical protein